MTAYRCQHAVVTEENEDPIVLAEHQAADPAAALRWVLHRASTISVHLSAPAAQTVESLLVDENERIAFMTALQAGYGYGFEITDPGTGRQHDTPTLHRFTARRPRSRPAHKTT